MLIPSEGNIMTKDNASLSRRVNANSQLQRRAIDAQRKLIKKGEC